MKVYGSSWLEAVIRVANCEGVSERRPGDEARLAFTKGGEFGLPDVVLLCEVSWLDVHELADRFDMSAVQDGRRGSAAAGVAIAARVPLQRIRSIVGSKATGEGGGIRSRPILGGRALRGRALWAIHAPPGRARVARTVYVTRALLRRGAVGGDWNLLPSVMRRLAGRRHYRSVGVLGIVLPRRWRVSEAAAVDIDSDHLAFDVRVRIPIRRSRAI